MYPGVAGDSIELEMGAALAKSHSVVRESRNPKFRPPLGRSRESFERPRFGALFFYRVESTAMVGFSVATKSKVVKNPMTAISTGSAVETKRSRSVSTSRS